MLYNKVKCATCVFNKRNISDEYKWTVYMHVFPNNKRYIGITHHEDPNIRWGVNGTNYAGQYVYTGIKKYGWDNIEHIILFNNLTLPEAALLEACYIALYSSNNIGYGYTKTCGGEFPLELVKTAPYLVVTPRGYIFCSDIRNIINIIKPYCYRLNTHQLKNFNSLISRHIDRQDWLKPIKRQKYIINKDIYVIELTTEEIKLFY